MKWLIRISNTHRAITLKELENLLDNVDIIWKNQLLFSINVEEEIVDDLIERSASIKWVMINPQILDIENSIYSDLDNLEISSQLPANETETFAARFTQSLGKDTNISKNRVERKVGAKLLEMYPDLQVNLDNPDQEYRIVLAEEVIYAGWIYKFVDFDAIASKSPKESPFFGGGAMKPMMVQLMVNQVPLNHQTILDPFCGHGGFLREIASMGKYAIGIELSWKIIRETKVNNQYHGVSNIAIIAGDALRSPIRENAIQAIVSDPPYAKQTTTSGWNPFALVNAWLLNQSANSIIVSLPDDMNINIPEFYVLEYETKDYVHRSLTRVVRKLRYQK